MSEPKLKHVNVYLEEPIFVRINKIIDVTKRSASSITKELIELGLGMWEKGQVNEAIVSQPALTKEDVQHMIDESVKEIVAKMTGRLTDEEKTNLYYHLKQHRDGDET